MAQLAPGIESRGKGLRIRIYWQGQAYTETDPGPCDAAHVKRCIRRREWLISRLRVGLPIIEGDARTLKQVAESYFLGLSVKASTLRSYQNLWKQRWLPMFGNYLPGDITAAMIRAELAKMEVSTKTKKNALTVLSGVLLHVDTNPNPCDVIRFPPRQKGAIRRYTPEEWLPLQSRLSGDAFVYFSLLRGTGMRPGEILALDWSDYDGIRIDVSKQIVRGRLIPTTKTSVSRRLVVPLWVRPILDAHVTRFAGKAIFTNQDGSRRLGYKDMNRAWRKAHTKARVPYRIPYTLRHTRAAELLSSGTMPARAAKELGHSLRVFLDIYSELMDEYSDEDLSLLEGPPSKSSPEISGARENTGVADGS